MRTSETRRRIYRYDRRPEDGGRSILRRASNDLIIRARRIYDLCALDNIPIYSNDESSSNAFCVPVTRRLKNINNRPGRTKSKRAEDTRVRDRRDI